MIDYVLRRIFGSKHDRDIRRLRPLVTRVNELEAGVRALSDDEIGQRAREVRQALAGGASLEEVQPEVFALVRESGRRRLGMRHFDVQLMGGAVLDQGKIAEMATGEGKTLVATLPAVLNGLTGRGVHIVTVNDYLARRDTQWMGPLYLLLDLTVGVIQHEASFLYDPSYVSSDARFASLRPCTRQEAYRADITYGTNNEFGFDYLRDNMRFSLDERVQRELHYAIVDEVDSILIDEARTPLIISGPAEESTDLYYKVDRIIPRLTRAATITEGKLHEIEEVRAGDYIVDEKAKTVTLTESGIAKCEQLLSVQNLYDPVHIDTLHHIHQALRAHTLFKRDVDYMVKDGQVIIVDEFTGRLMPGRRWSDGLHQAVEAKEGVRIERENQTLATITFQNLFRMYDKLAGMTGTADTEAAEFAKIYKLDVVVVPTNRSLIRTNHPDVVYKTEAEKFDAVVAEIKALHESGRPVLIGTVSIEKSERLSKLLKRHGVPHQVLNAKYHEKEAEIVAQAGRMGAVTIATNMAGRGTDILLGGNPDFLARDILRRRGLDPLTAAVEERQRARDEAGRTTDEEHRQVVDLGGLHILGTERHESRRIDNQLRGRSGRQGDPGSSRFYLSLEDDLLRIFGSHRIQKIMDKLGMEEGEPIEHRFVTRAIATAQKRVETHHFEIRKHLLEYDDVMNKQRQAVYEIRLRILQGESLEERVREWMDDLQDGMVDTYAAEGTHPEDWDLAGLDEALHRQFDVRLPADVQARETASREALRKRIAETTHARYETRERELGAETMRQLERWVVLQVIDGQWKDHLLSMDHLKEGIGLRGYGQRDPLTEYKREAFDLFEDMDARVKTLVVEYLFKIQVTREVVEPAAAAPPARPAAPRREVTLSHGPVEHRRAAAASAQKVGRNDPCPCGSGKKHKRCCLAKA
jgi:preprotein translocase subunit SecA